MTNIRIPQDYKENVNRAFHNLSKVARTTMHPGLKYPIYCRRVFLGDDFKLSIPAKLLQSQPTISPVMGSYKLRVEWYYQSDTNLYGWLDNNDKQSTQTILNQRKHRFIPITVTNPDPGSYQYDLYELSDDGSNSAPIYFRTGKVGIGRGSLMDYLGVAPCYVAPAENDDVTVHQFGNVWNMDTVLMYLNIARSYWTNPQWPNIPYVGSAFGGSGAITPNPFYSLSLTDMDNLFKWLRTKEDGVELNLNDDTWQSLVTMPNSLAYEEKYRRAVYNFGNYLRSVCVGGPSSGLFCCQYEPDLYRNLMSDEIGALKSKIDTTSGVMTIEELRFANHLQLVIDRLDISGGRFSDWARTRWGVKTRKNLDRPQLLGVTTEYIDTGLVTSRENSRDAEGDLSSPGQMHGNINQRPGKSGFVRVKVTEPGYIMAVVSVVPEVDYCQNIERYLLDIRFEDEFSPQYSRRGFENVPRSDYSALVDSSYSFVDEGDVVGDFLQTTYPLLATSVGKQVAWLREMTDVNRVHGEFSNFGMYETWVLKRQYTIFSVYDDEYARGVEVSDFKFSPYVNPLEWQYPFVGQDLFAPNFYLQAAIKVDAIRPVGRRYLPSLE